MKVKNTPSPYKKAKFAIYMVFIAAILMYVLNLVTSNAAGIALYLLFGEDYTSHEVIWMLSQMGAYLIMHIITGGFLLLVFRKNPLSPFKGAPSTPLFPFLFFPAAIGGLYIFNLTVSLLFGGWLEPFEQAIDASMFPSTPIGIILYMIMISILPAIFEEWLFRGIIQKNLASSVGKGGAIFLSALIFGMMHLDPAQSAFAFLFGLIFGYAYHKTGSIWFGVLLHFANNMISAVASYWIYVFPVEWVQILISLFMMTLMGIAVLAVPAYIVYAVLHKRKMVRKTDEERSMPSCGTVLKMTFCNPLLYVMCIMYVLLLWLLYFAVA